MGSDDMVARETLKPAPSEIIIQLHANRRHQIHIFRAITRLHITQNGMFFGIGIKNSPPLQTQRHFICDRRPNTKTAKIMCLLSRTTRLNKTWWIVSDCPVNRE